MDLKWFLRYLTLTRWSKLLAIFFACIFFGILTFYFVVLQANHRPLEWHFKNCNVFTHEVTFEKERTYKIWWEQSYKAYPVAVAINGVKANIDNNLRQRFVDRYDARCYVTIRNPFFVRVSQDTDFKLFFRMTTPVSTQSLGDIFSGWFEGLGDEIAFVDWHVTDVTDSLYSTPLTVDGSFEIQKYTKK